jgi:hypothetical protein
MTKENAKKLYEGKFFYEIVKVKAGRHAGTVQLFGPFDNIYYLSDHVKNDVSHELSKFKFVQVIEGRPTVCFTEEEILVTDRKL